MSLLKELKQLESEILNNSIDAISAVADGHDVNHDLIELVVKNVVWSLVLPTMCLPLPDGETVQSVLQANLNQSGIQVDEDDPWEGQQVSLIYSIVEEIGNGLQTVAKSKPLTIDQSKPLTDDDVFRSILAEERE